MAQMATRPHLLLAVSAVCRSPARGLSHLVPAPLPLPLIGVLWFYTRRPKLLDVVWLQVYEAMHLPDGRD